MQRGYRGWLLTALVLTGLQMLAATSAHAHWLTVEATSACTDTGTAVINYRVASFSLNQDGTNTKVDLSLNGVVIRSDAFKIISGNEFTGTVNAPSGASAVLSAVAAADWGDGQSGGQSDSVTVATPTDCVTPGLGRFTGGGHQIRVGVARVTRGLTIHCDLLLSNNLEINWGGNQFHMTEHLQTVACTDDPSIIQAPPDAPLDTLVGVGTGRYNGTSGYTVEFTLVDAGEPGSSDEAALKVYETANPTNVVLDVPLQLLSGGNLQAHYDQPHK